ncbi:MAG: hypothetical protein IPN59_12650 [Holophaga sp.]|nr:hypothetical protein [Holophaga sp.]
MASGFSITNTNPSAANVTLAYHWPNGDLAHTQGLVIQAFGRAVVYLPNIPELGDLFGYVQVTSDQPSPARSAPSLSAHWAGASSSPTG